MPSCWCNRYTMLPAAISLVHMRVYICLLLSGLQDVSKEGDRQRMQAFELLSLQRELLVADNEGIDILDEELAVLQDMWVLMRCFPFFDPLVYLPSPQIQEIIQTYTAFTFPP